MPFYSAIDPKLCTPKDEKLKSELLVYNFLRRNVIFLAGLAYFAMFDGAAKYTVRLNLSTACLLHNSVYSESSVE